MKNSVGPIQLIISQQIPAGRVESSLLIFPDSRATEKRFSSGLNLTLRRAGANQIAAADPQ